jgi:hypothetical protein
MRLQLLSWLACGVVLLSGASTPQGASADEALIQRFLQESPQRWSEYEALLRGFDVQGEVVTGNEMIFTLSNYGLPEPRFPKPGRVKF